MTNRPKAIGTAAETAVVRYLAAHGFPAAERRARAHQTDHADGTVARHRAARRTQ